MGKNEKIIESLRKELQLNPQDTILMNDLALLLDEMNDYRGALFYLEKAAEINPNVQTLYNLAIYLDNEGGSSRQYGGF